MAILLVGIVNMEIKPKARIKKQASIISMANKYYYICDNNSQDSEDIVPLNNYCSGKP